MFATLHAGIGVKQTHSYARSLRRFFSLANVSMQNKTNSATLDLSDIANIIPKYLWLFVHKCGSV